MSYLWPQAHRTVLRQFIRRDIHARYRGSVLGLGWAFVAPLFMLLVYTFVFVGVFRAQWPGRESGGGVEFALQTLAGLVVFQWFSEVVSRAPNLVLDQANLVKKVVFPLETLSWVSLLSSAFHAALTALILLLAATWAHDGIGWTVLALPVVGLALLPWLLGLSWGLSALGVYVRDLGPMVGMATSVLMFMSPVFYAPQALPEVWQSWIWLNPLTVAMQAVRSALLLGIWPDWAQLGTLALGGSAMALAGAAFFHKTRKGFADVL